MRLPVYIIGTSILCRLKRGDYAFLSVEYNLYTTAIVYGSVPHTDVPPVSIITFSADEVEQYANYFYANKTLRSIGFNDSSVIYYAAKNHCSMIVNDAVTIRACTELGIEYVELTDLLTQEEGQAMTG